MDNLDIIFNALHWDSYDDDTDNFVIESYGRTIDDKSIYVKILDFTPHFYVEIPKKWTEYIINKGNVVGGLMWLV